MVRPSQTRSLSGCKELGGRSSAGCEVYYTETVSDHWEIQGYIGTYIVMHDTVELTYTNGLSSISIPSSFTEF